MAGTSKVARARVDDLSTEVLGLLLLGVTTFLFLSFYSEHLVANHGGSGTLSNLCGAAGKLLSGIAFQWLGVWASYLLIVILAIWALCVFFRVSIQSWSWKLFGASLLLVSTASLEWYFTSAGEALVGAPYDMLRGGYLEAAEIEHREVGVRLLRQLQRDIEVGGVCPEGPPTIPPQALGQLRERVLESAEDLLGELVQPLFGLLESADHFVL